MVTPYPHEKSLFTLSVIASVFFWPGLVLVSIFAIDLYLPEMGLPFTLVFARLATIVTYAGSRIHSARRVAYLRGHAVEIGPKQYPDLYARVKAVCKRLQIENNPSTYLFHNPRFSNSFYVRLDKQDYLVLNAETIGALTEHQGAIDFIIGYELGRLHYRRRAWAGFTFPARALPLLGAGLARAQIYTFDKYGIEACKAKADAALALAVQASGIRRWKSFNIAQFATQSAAIQNFWMSLYELISPSPWLSKRMAYLRATATNSESLIPRHSRLAFFVALFVPYAAPVSLAGVARFMLVPLWAMVIAFTSVVGYQQIKTSGLVNLIGNYYQSMFGQMTDTQAQRPRNIPAAGAPATEDKNNTRAYSRLFADLTLLGGYAEKRQKRHGGIPCEIGNLSALRLNYLPGRYSFSCDEPVVYTFVEQGEFEPGRASHIRKYNWKTKAFILESAGSN